jgi:hypothetical protein
MDISENELLKQLQQERPLHNSWLKRDALSIEECVYAFNNIEPFSFIEKSI